MQVVSILSSQKTVGFLAAPSWLNLGKVRDSPGQRSNMLGTIDIQYHIIYIIIYLDIIQIHSMFSKDVQFWKSFSRLSLVASDPAGQVESADLLARDSAHVNT